MGLFKNIRRALRGGKALPNEHGPRFVKRDSAKTEAPAPKVSIKVVKATTDDKPTTIPSAEKKAPAKKAVAKSPAKKAPAKKAPTKKSTPKKK